MVNPTMRGGVDGTLGGDLGGDVETRPIDASLLEEHGPPPDFRDMSYTQNLIHIVINTKRRRMTIPALHAEDLYRYIWLYTKGKQSKLIRIGGIENHIHIFVDLHPSVSMASFVGEMKRSTSLWMKKTGLFPDFDGWGAEYYAASKSDDNKEVIINYIKNQREHHARQTYEDELKHLLIESGHDPDQPHDPTPRSAPPQPHEAHGAS